MGVRLRGKQTEELKDALLTGFYDETDLEKLARFELDEHLPRIVKSDTLDTMTLKLIEWAEKKDRLDDLLAGAMAERPRNTAIRRMALAISLTSESLPGAKLESNVVPGVGYPDVATWRARMEQIERTVCLVELPGGQVIGTGFLVAPDVVMTNYHVAHNATGKLPTAVRFDYRTDEQGAPLAADETHACAAAPILAESPVAALDYALLRLETSPGTEDVPGRPGVSRGALAPSAHAFIRDEPLFVLQHPLTQRLKLGVGTIRDLQLPRRVFYSANTEPGSSGSPCFTIQWDLVALHHQGDTGTGANNGIPLAAIADDLREKNLLAPLGLAW